ncbi:MAG: GWxTD domain-containing protein [Bacteroidota bacterium]
MNFTSSSIRIKLVGAVALLFLLACSTSSVKVSNYSYLYSRDLLLHPEFRVFNASEDSSYLYFKINTLNLLYTREAKNNDFAARIKVEVGAFNNFSDKFPFYRDSSEYLDIDNGQLAKDLIGRFSLPLPAGRNYVIKVNVTDLNRNTSDTKIIRVLKEGQLIDRQGFLAVDAYTKVPVISKILKNEKQLLISHHLEERQEVNVTFFDPSIYLARPPFDTEAPQREMVRPYATYTLYDSAGYFPLEVIDRTGIYFIQSDTNSFMGTTFFKFAGNHPMVTTGEQMVGPLQYIASNEEFRKLIQAPNKKIAAENFWIEHCGSRERAREVIRAFYKRVEEANEFFTSYKEGWKTDRGMIYIIFGPPDGLYMRDGGESWVYGQESNVNSINLVFIKNENPFSDNDLVLQRSLAYRPNWYLAVDYWRTGRIFTL